MDEFWLLPESLAFGALFLLAAGITLASLFARWPWKLERRVIALATVLAWGGMLILHAGGFLRDRAEISRDLAILEQPATWLANPEEHRRRDFDRQTVASRARSRVENLDLWMLLMSAGLVGLSVMGLDRALTSREPEEGRDPELEAAEDRLRADGLIK